MPCAVQRNRGESSRRGVGDEHPRGRSTASAALSSAAAHAVGAAAAAVSVTSSVTGCTSPAQPTSQSSACSSSAAQQVASSTACSSRRCPSSPTIVTLRLTQHEVHSAISQEDLAGARSFLCTRFAPLLCGARSSRQPEPPLAGRPTRQPTTTDADSVCGRVKWALYLGYVRPSCSRRRAGRSGGRRRTARP